MNTTSVRPALSEGTIRPSCAPVMAALCATFPNPTPRQAVLEPEEANNLLHSELARFDFTALERKAADLRNVLIENGWTARRVSCR